MRLMSRTVALSLISSLLVSSPVFAQQARVVDTAALHRALAVQAETERGEREQIARVLGRDDVRQMAARLGLDVARASSAVATLSGADLSTAARHAAALDAGLAGGASTIVISTTTLLLIIIIVILLAN